jgi:hypothetical protein
VTPTAYIQLAIFGGTLLVAGLGWSLRRNVASLDKGITALGAAVERVATDVRQLSATVSSHENSLGKGDVKINDLERRVTGLEERERERGCFGACRHSEGEHPARAARG